MSDRTRGKSVFASGHDARRRVVCGLGLAAPLLLLSRHAAADAFPDRTIRLVVPFPAGGPTDIVARPLALLLSQAIGGNVVIENKGGAGGGIGAEVVAHAAPDGYTLFVGTDGTQAINPTLYRKLSYEPKTFTPLAIVASAPVAVVVNAKAPWTDLAQLIAAARKDPEHINFGSAGNGTPGHLTGELFSRAAGVQFKHVPYRGSAPAVTDLVGGQIQVMFDPVQSVLAQVQAGNLRALAVSSAVRSPVLPQVPTFAQCGVKDCEAEAWWGVFGPPGLPGDRSDLLRNALAKVVASEDFKGRLVKLGVTPSEPVPDLQAWLLAERTKWGNAVRGAHITID
ncbi:MAG: Bug family tripartite tricarboxylate transporter substrate binding protein [Burkholderiales bacterium]